MQTPAYLELVHERIVDEGPSSVRFLSSFAQLSVGDIRQLWDRWDVNGDGTIDSKELGKMLTEITLYTAGHQFVPEEVLSTTRAALENEGGVIDWRSFRDYMSAYGISVRG